MFVSKEEGLFFSFDKWSKAAFNRRDIPVKYPEAFLQVKPRDARLFRLFKHTRSGAPVEDECRARPSQTWKPRQGPLSGATDKLVF